MKHKEHFHGSDLEKIEKYYGIKKEDIVSFSANVNPLGLSEKLKASLSEHLDVLTAYPDREYTGLRQAIAAYCQSEADYVSVGNGSTELIALFIKALAPKRALVIAPTYSEYEHELENNKSQTDYFILDAADDFVLNVDKLKQSLSAADYDMLMICNPNNPTSGTISQEDLRSIIAFCQDKNTFVLIDETYAEFVPEAKNTIAIPLTQEFENVAVLRGVSKFFASPGLRLGYAICQNQELRATIAALQNAWSINSLAEAAGKLMFTDSEYIERTRSFIAAERDRLYSELSQIPALKPYPPTANFILVKILTDKITAQDLFDAAIKDGMMIRDCASFVSLDESYFRLCIMSEKDNTRLMNCIRQCFIEEKES